MKKGLNIILIVLVVLLIIVSGYLFYFNKNPKSAVTLSGVEVREYEGERLSSVSDFRENSIKGPQYIDKDIYLLEVSGLVKNPRNFSYDEVINRQNYEKVVTLNCVEGWSAKILWKGVLVRDILEQVGVEDRVKTIILYAEDGYSTSFDYEYVIDNDIILAHMMNDVTLPPERGFPFQLVAESKWGYKWIKWITKIELSSEDYIGYWESRGYSDSGNLDENFLK